MSEIKEQDRKKDEEGQVAIKRLSKPIKGRILLAQIFTIFSALLSFVPYLALVWLGDIFLSAQTTGEQIDAVQVHKVVNLLVMAFLSKLFFHALSLIITHFADMKLRFIIRQRIVERLSHVPLTWFSQTDSGKIRNAVQDDTKTVHTVVAHAPVDMLNGVLAPLVLQKKEWEGQAEKLWGYSALFFVPFQLCYCFVPNNLEKRLDTLLFLLLFMLFKSQSCRISQEY